MQLFPRERTDYIAKLLKDYFNHPKRTISDAQDMVHYEQGAPSPVPRRRGRPRKVVRPPKERLEMIALRDKWRPVFRELERRCAHDRDAEAVLRLAFRDRYKDEDICDMLLISPPSYYNYRIKILQVAAVLAVQAGIIDF